MAMSRKIWFSESIPRSSDRVASFARRADSNADAFIVCVCVCVGEAIGQSNVSPVKR